MAIPLELELSILTVSLLIVAEFAGGFINTLAGGGSMLTLPVLMMVGMPADVANATNRVGVFLQSATAAKGFKKLRPTFDSGAIVPMLVPTVLGALLGALLASYLPVWLLKPTLLAAMIAMAIYMLVKPDSVVVPEGTEAHGVFDKPSGFLPYFSPGYTVGSCRRVLALFCWLLWLAAYVMTWCERMR